MRIALILLVAIAGVMMAFDPDGGPSSAYQAPPPGRADITITVLNDYTISGFTYPRGLDYADNFGALVMSDYGTDYLYTLDPDNGSVTSSSPCPPEVPDVFGVASIEVSPGLWHSYINDWGSVMDIWVLEGAGWNLAFPNPVSEEPRGMDFDDDEMLWAVDGSTRYLYRFDTGGGNVSSWYLAELPAAYASGISTFPCESNLGIAVGGYYFGDFYFYEFDGASLSYIGSAPVPQAATSSYGIAYSRDRETFFWLYLEGTTIHHITEFELDIEAALTGETWGAIKTLF